MAGSQRYGQQAASETSGKLWRTIRGMFSRRVVDLDLSDGDRVTAIGREAADGSFEADEMDTFAPVGIIGRPAENAEVESAVCFVGGDGAHPIAVGYLDGTRRAVIETEGLDVDETIIYTSGLVIRLTAEGTIEARTLGGTAKRLAFHDDVQAIRDALHEHEHTYKLEGVDTFTTGGPSVPSSTGTSVLMGE